MSIRVGNLHGAQAVVAGPVMPTFVVTPSVPQLRLPVDHITFGQRSYGGLFATVPLTPAQRPIAEGIQSMEAATGLTELPTYLSLLHHPQYQFLSSLKWRIPNHSPFTELFFRLKRVGDQAHLIRRLSETALQTASPLARGNASAELANLYFYALRPGGQAETVWGGSILGRQRHRYLQGKVLKTFEALDTPVFRDMLRYRWLQLSNSNFLNESPVLREKVEQTREQIMPIINRPLHSLTTRPVLAAQNLLDQLNDALDSPDADKLRKMSESGVLSLLIPEWRRLMGPDNVQHDGQDHNLLEHSLAVVEGTKASPHYQVLSPAEKRLVSVAALLHDVGKKTAPANLHPLIPVDREHPLRSADIARQILPTLGFSAEETARVSRLILHHTLVGSMNMRYEVMPPNAVLEQAAIKLRHPALVDMLHALTEGDIRGVRRDGVLYTPLVAKKVGRLSQSIGFKVRRNLESGFYLPRTDWDKTLVARSREGNTNLYVSLYDTLRQANQLQSAIRMEGNFPVVRLTGRDDYNWMVMPYDRLLDPQAVRRSFLDEPLYPVTWMRTAELQRWPARFGLLVDVLPEDVALASHQPVKSPKNLNAHASTFEEIVTGRSVRPEIQRLIHLRREERLRYEPLAMRHGFESWGEAMAFLLREELKPKPAAPCYVALVRDIREMLAQSGGVAHLIATRPRVKAVYAVSADGKNDLSLNLPPALRKLLTEKRLPLVIVSPS